MTMFVFGKTLKDAAYISQYLDTERQTTLFISADNPDMLRGMHLRDGDVVVIDDEWLTRVGSNEFWAEVARMIHTKNVTYIDVSRWPSGG